MTAIRRIIVFVLTVLVVSLPMSGLLYKTGAGAEEIPPAPPPVDCQEDAPCWDCTTMGNFACGPVAIIDPMVIVAPAPAVPVEAEAAFTG